jgi:hypothetical protein
MLPVLEQWVDVPMSRVLAFALWANVPFPTLKPVVGVKVLQIRNVGPTDFGGGINEVILGDRCSQCAIRYLNRPVVAVDAIRILTMVCLELCKSVAEQKNASTSERTFLAYGSNSSAPQPGVFQESKSERCARVYIMKFIDEPPPSVPPQGTMGSRSARCADLLPL